MSQLGMKKPSSWTYEQALEKLPELLKAEGFGILTQIDVKETLKAKLGLDFRKYRILGACNPTLAHQALSAVVDLGVMLPCNVVVYEGDDGKAVVTSVDPMQTIAAARPELAPIASEVRARLARVLEQVG
ncbi:protein of unknown function DUF302 [Anaeromyxobacter sp. K]|uniref:DUF302 domain-containing protein n=1 Tax=Anaeromyxobacter dehalogenans (strain ATCC BAA-258 / DSM 21875 / 2CP-1) TaxID=455488 RepID=B8J9K4_ANAD2|nr:MULTISPECIES: DUF302 domain-containing protein [Anaeromyxobacter]ACG75247.1 protein of unknown function DUF302 [Anaeromyxobacter sp. K]ACL67392.1 protein of unknown function DUF302 [Anaeromyxobacter dehalogenans 2CP-1]